MIWPSNFPFYLSPDGDGGGGADDGASEDGNPADGLDQSTVDYLKSKNIDPAKASSTQIAVALMAEIKGKDKQLKDEIKGRQTERQKRQDLQRQMETPKSITSLLEDSNTDAGTKTELQNLINKAAEASEFQDSVSQLVDNGTISNELLEVLQAGPKATKAALKAIGSNTGGKSPSAEDGVDAEDKMVAKILEKLGIVGGDLHQSKNDHGDGKKKSLLSKYQKVDRNTQAYIDGMKKNGSSNKE